MEKSTLLQAEKYTRNQRFNKRWKKIVAAISITVIFGTVYALTLPAITMETNCGLTEHQHNDECYTTVPAIHKQMDCNRERLNVHQHIESCWNENGELICGYSDTVLHRHDELCFDEEHNLICVLSENKEHSHTEACYSVQDGSLICTQDEWIEHQHNDGCYDENNQIICGKLEIIKHQHTEQCIQEVEKENKELICTLSVHTHDENCYPTEKEEITYYCDKEAHSHTNECKDELGNLICTLEEHLHDEDCLIEQKEEIIYYCDKEAHSHTNECKDELGNLICTLEEHLHDEDCLIEQKEEITYYCDKEAHSHTDECKDEEENLICALEEHVHDESCLEEIEAISEVDLERIDECISLIDRFPSLEEFEARLSELEASGDMDAYQTYYKENLILMQGAFACYQALNDEKLQSKVTNRQKLFDLEFVYTASTYVVSNEVSVDVVNGFSWSASSIIVRNDTAEAKTIADCNAAHSAFLYWVVVQIENKNGQYVVTEITDKDKTSKADLLVAANSFALVYHPENYQARVGAQPNIKKGDVVVPSSNFWKNNHGFTSGTVHGKLTFTTVNHLETVDAADTSSLLTLNLYNYNSTINDKYNKNHKYPGFQQDNGSIDVKTITGTNFGNNITEDLKAGVYGMTNNSDNGLINKVNNQANSALIGAMNTLLVDGYPQTKDGVNLKYLFDDTYKVNTENINGLFKYNAKTGRYWFDSRENHAQYSNNKFTLYKQIITANFIWYPFGNFLPFDDITKEASQTSTINRTHIIDTANLAKTKASTEKDSTYKTAYTNLYNSLTTWVSLMDAACENTTWDYKDMLEKGSYTGATYSDYTNLYSLDYDKPTDFYFGMDMEMDFVQPLDGLTGVNHDQPMTFEFSGDDDVWVYIDGKLVLDLSGIHRHVGGTIDFVNGTVTYRHYKSYTNAEVTDVDKTLTKTFKDLGLDNLNEKGTFENYTEHNLHFYYMERGSGSSVCELNFNFPILRKNSIQVGKELSSDKPVDLLGSPDFYFQVLDENKQLYIKPNTQYNVLNSAHQVIEKRFTDKHGVFTLKAGEIAEFPDVLENQGQYFVRELFDKKEYEQYGDITVSGNSITLQGDLVLGETAFVGADSPLKDISDGTTYFKFNNQVDTSKLGSLSIEKKLTEYSDAEKNSTFIFEVTLDGQLLPKGTQYQVSDVTKTVENAGEIVLSPDEKAVISNIISGTEFTVKEKEASSNGYVVEYYIDDALLDKAEASGQIDLATQVDILVHNKEKGIGVEIPVHKTVKDFDGTKQSFTFRLEQITSATDLTPTNPSFSRDCIINDMIDDATGSFELGYAQVDIHEDVQYFYYKVYEVSENNPGMIYDDSVYIVEVKVEKLQDGLSASISRILKNDELVNGNELLFVNENIRYELPQTGGSGIYGCTLGGAILIFVSLLLYIYKRKQEGSLLRR